MSQPHQEDLLAGRYRMAGVLGAGGMADVYRAWDTQLDRPVAVKVFRPTDEETAGRRFDNEVRTLAGLSHPALVPVYDAGHANGRRFVVLRLIEGPTLRERIAEGPLPIPEVREVGACLARALAHIHARDVVHRDVKPSNILLDGDGNAHLADFGLARSTGATQLTRADQIVGTAAYLAPEQVRGEEVGGPADVYALGLVLLECLTGYREFDGTQVEAALARLHRPPRVPDDLPEDLIRLLRLMTALPPLRRPTAEACARALADDEPVTSALALTEPAAMPDRSRKVMNFGLAAAAAVGLAGIVGFGLASAPDASPDASPPTTTATSTPAPPPSSSSSVGSGVSTVTVEVPVPAPAPEVAVPAGPQGGGVKPDKAEPPSKPQKGKGKP